MVPTAPSLHDLSVLVIDDHRDTVDVLLEYLTACGATAFGAGSAKSALAIVEAHMVDAAVVDLRMPREDGWWFLISLILRAVSPASSSSLSTWTRSRRRSRRYRVDRRRSDSLAAKN